MVMIVDITTTTTVTTGVLVAVHLMPIVSGDFVSVIGVPIKVLEDVNVNLAMGLIPGVPTLIPKILG